MIHKWAKAEDAQLAIDGQYVCRQRDWDIALPTIARYTSQGTFWCPEMDDVLSGPIEVLSPDMGPIPETMDND